MANVLLGNDDGIDSIGLEAVVKALSKRHDVYVSAPQGQQSGKSASITLHGNIEVEEVEYSGAVKAYKVAGTPVDSIKYGFQKLKKSGIDVDFIISGVNLGANAGMDAHYSGTVGVAMEGAMLGIHSIALSVASHSAKYFEYITNILPEVMNLSKKLPVSTVLNVNSPDLPHWQIKGLKIMEAGPLGFNDTFVNSAGENIYKYSGEGIDYSSSEKNHDFHEIQNGYATITPLNADYTDFKGLRKLLKLKGNLATFILMDLQDNLIQKSNVGERVLKNNIKLIKCLNKLNIDFTMTHQFGKGMTNISKDILEHRGNNNIIEKISFDLLETPNFEENLDLEAGKRVVLTGFETHISILQSAISFLDKGYEVTVIKDCTASQNNEDYETAIENMKQAGVQITTLESYIFQLIENSSHFAYREILNILGK